MQGCSILWTLWGERNSKIFRVKIDSRVKTTSSYFLIANTLGKCGGSYLQHLIFIGFFAMFLRSVAQIVICPRVNSHQLRIYTVKVVLSEIWFERNQCIFQDKSLQWFDHFEIARVKASSWCSLSKNYSDYLIDVPDDP